MVAYVDSSVLLRYVLLGDVGMRHVMEFPRLVSSELLEIECRRTVQRCRLQGELSDQGLVAAMGRLEETLDMIDLIELDHSMKRRAMGSFPVVVKTLDALHLSTALRMAEQDGMANVHVFSHDKAMNLCARALGLGAPLLTLAVE